MTSENRIRKEISRSEIEVSRVYQGEYDKEGTITAELKQTVTTKSHYPGKSVVNDKQDNIFSAADFNFEEQEYENKEVRVAWIPVPEGMNQEQVQTQLDNFPEANLYKVLSNQPIITDAQQYAIDNGITSIDVFANAQAVRYPKGHEQEGELALDKNGNIQYRAIFFSNSGKEDQDNRVEDKSQVYMSEELAAELKETAVIADDQIV